MNTDFLKRIKRLENDVIAYKMSQPIGSDSVVTYANQTDKDWDIDITKTSSLGSDYYYCFFPVRFVADRQDSPFGRCRIYAEVNGVPYNYRTHSSNYLSSTTPYITVFEDDDQLATNDEFANGAMLRFVINCSIPNNQNLKIKFIVDATDTGRAYLRAGSVIDSSQVEI